MAQKKKKDMENEASEIEVKLTPDQDTPQNRIYSNFARISQTPYDFSLVFCDATPINIDKKTKGKIVHKIPVVAEIAVPYQLIPGLIKALQTQWNIYNENVSGGPDGKKSS